MQLGDNICKKAAALGEIYAMTDKIYAVPAAWKKRALVDAAGYEKSYAESVKNPAKFWGKQSTMFPD